MIVNPVTGGYSQQKNPFDQGQSIGCTAERDEAILVRRLQAVRNDQYRQTPLRSRAWKIALAEQPTTAKWMKARAALQALLMAYMRTHVTHQQTMLRAREKSAVLLRAIRRIQLSAEGDVIGMELAPITQAQDMVALLKALLLGQAAQPTLCEAIRAYVKGYLHPDIEVKHIARSQGSSPGLLIETSRVALCVSLKNVAGYTVQTTRNTKKKKTFSLSRLPLFVGRARRVRRPACSP